MSWGVFTSRSRLQAEGAAEAVAEVESLGFDTLWVGDPREELDLLAVALGWTSRLQVATGVLSVWAPTAETVAAWRAGLPEAQRSRVLLGLGVSHSLLVPHYAKPLATMAAYLDALDAVGVPAAGRMIGANGPKMVALAGRRTAGTLTYLTLPERTAEQRSALGSDPAITAEVKVVLAPDRDEAYRLAREHLAIYLRLPNYLGNLRAMGYGDDDLTAPGSDRFVDALVVRGVAGAAKRAAEHRAAGATSVAFHVLSDTPLPVAEWRELAALVGA
ncbi:MAG: TIGR03620 family F420-dependent LLM class oxidoreductase [Sporichthyaceae bacterium]